MGDLKVFDFMLKSSGRLCFVALLTFGSPAISQGEQVPMSEFDLRALVPFGADDILKYAACEVNSYPNCTYVWGVFDSDDELRVKLGGKPDGDKLLTVFAQAHSSQDFDRVLAVTPDAQPVEGLGIKAVWSERRHQLSLMSEDFMAIHVNIDALSITDPRTTAIQIATFLLGEE